MTVGIAIMGSLFFATAALAEDPKPTIQHPSMKAKYVSQSIPDPIEIEAGASKTVTFNFKNVGTETWNSWNQHRNGYRHVSAYTMEPRDRASAFRGSNWISAKQTASITKDTKPGEIAVLEIELKAPDKPGMHKEEFYLAAENYSWIDGGYFFVKIKVVEKKAAPPPKAETPSEPDVSQVTVSTTPTYQAKRIFQGKRDVSVKGGEQVQMALAFQNLGENTWERYQIVSNVPSSTSGDTLTFADTAWKSTTVAASKDQSIEQFGIVRETFSFRAPAKKGTYKASFFLQADDELFDDVVGHVSVTVTEDAPSHYQPPHIKKEVVEVFTPRLPSEPRIRVGIWKPEDAVQFRSYEDDYDIYDGTIKMATLPKKQMAVLKFVNGKYELISRDIVVRSADYIRLSPVSNPRAVFVLHNFDRKVTWKSPDSFNQYRGAMEYRLTQDGETMYVINDLLMEDYVAGIGENSNNSPEEYLKSQSVAQRTYAYYIKEHSDKHNKRNFDVVAHTGDQLYLGYNNESIMNRFVAAAKATRGYMVTYNDDIVVTPYFARTHCRTKGWHEVWGGKVRPWLVSVKTNYDCQRGLRALGHLVGMSQIDASIRAKKEGLNFKELLAYYYTGTKAERIYE